MLRIFLLYLSFSAIASARGNGYPIWLHNDNAWNRAQIMHLQTQQQLQSQDQYRRNLLLQDQLWQLQRLQDQQDDLNFMLHNSNMHQHIDRLKRYSRSLTSPSAKTKSK